jgi:predicted metal-binding protein
MIRLTPIASFQSIQKSTGTRRMGGAIEPQSRPCVLEQPTQLSAKICHLQENPMTSWITICDTCKREGWTAESQPLTDGEVFADLIEARAAAAGVKTRRVSCMMGCVRACNVAVQAPDKLSYVLGTFEPSPENAQAIVDYAALHQTSQTGQVPYRDWPQAVKGHFTTRMTPVPDTD